MTCWDVLGIAPTQNHKAIKKAYAILLKQNKPDENPEGFSKLHNAYKESLYYAQEMERESAQYTQDNEPITEQLEVSNNQPIQEVIEPAVENQIQNQNNEHHKEINQYLESLDSSWDDICEQTNSALKNLKHKENIADWEFIASSEALYDFQFKNHYTYYLFENLLTFFNNQKNISPKKRANVILYLDKHLNWSDIYGALVYEFGEEATNDVFDVLLTPPHLTQRKLLWVVPSIHKGPMEIGNYYARIAATVIDGIILYMLADIIVNLNAVVYNNSFFISLALYVCTIPIMEASPLQGSLGKILFGLKVTNRKGKRLNVFHGITRQLTYLICMAGIKIVVWINLIVMRDGILLHDKLSLSRVIKRY